MIVKELHLRHYRNYGSCELFFKPGIHLFIGNNAQGKTNLLEALYVLALGKSHRTSKDKELIKWREDYALLQARIQTRNSEIPLSLSISGKGKQAKVNHLEQKRLSDYIGHLNVVMFAPEDLELVKGSPGKRRRFLDMEIGQTSPAYLYELGRYHKLLSQRNTLLKDWSRRRENRPMVEVFTDQLIAVAAQIIYKRIGFVQVLKDRARPIHEQITAGKETLSIVYVPSVPVEQNMTAMHISTLLTEQFRQIVEQEERRGTTLIGPHRDDLEFYVNDRSVQTFGSQGQQRTTALAVKLAEIELIQQEVGDYPILLLDDVLSELDDHRRSHLLQAIQHKVQTFVTNTSLEGIDPVTLRESFVYDVREGRITVRRGE